VLLPAVPLPAVLLRAVLLRAVLPPAFPAESCALTLQPRPTDGIDAG
jgi:hypothetical protein